MKQLLIIITLALLAGCAGIPLTHDQCNATKFPTAMEHEQCLRATSDYEQKQYEKEDKRIIRRDKLIVFLNDCDASPRLELLEKRYLRSVLPSKNQIRKARREHGRPYTHDNVSPRARRIDFLCIDVSDFMRQMERR